MAQTGSAQAAGRRQPTDRRGTEVWSTSSARQPISPEQVDAALRVLPSDGWTHGWTGRRDRALLVLSQMAGLPFQAIAELTIADIAVANTVATIRTPGGSTTLQSAPDGRTCGPCGLARWLHALDLTSIYSRPGVVTAVLARAAPLTANSPHLCAGTVEVCERTRSMLVLPSVDQWGPCVADGRPAPGSIGDDAGPTPMTQSVQLVARPIINRRAVPGRPSRARPRTTQAPDKAARGHPENLAIAHSCAAPAFPTPRPIV
ncbi:MAG: hypothetical protein ABJD68_18075, partial [Nakamurella sp.]